MPKKILLCSLGSRGDVEPFLALGEELLEDKGNEIAFCFSEQFCELAAQVGGSFYPMTTEFLDLMNRPDVKAVMGQTGSRWSRLISLRRLLKETASIQKQLLLDQQKAVADFEPDEIYFHVKCIYPVIQGLQKGKVTMVSPIPCMIVPVDHEPHIGFGNPLSRAWNRITYNIAMTVLVKTAFKYSKEIARTEGVTLKKKELRDYYLNKVNIDFAVHPDLFPRPKYWRDNARVVGFRERNKFKHFNLSENLNDFLKKYPDPIYVGFGSMVNSMPHVVGRDVVEVCKELGQPVIINTSWGGIEVGNKLPELVHVTDDIPHDFLFKKVKAIVHHGGAGTTHSGFRYRVPQLIIPHIADQSFWSRTIVNSGEGVKGFPIRKWTRDRFRNCLIELLAFSGNRSIT